MQIEPGMVITGIVSAIGALAWLFRLEGRINLVERVTQDLGNDVKEIKSDVKQLLRQRRQDD